MTDTLLSPHWYRIQDLHPRLRPHVEMQLHQTRGQTWCVLHNQATGRFHRVNAHAYELVGRLDGRHTVDAIWKHLLQRLGDDAPSQSDVIRVLGQLTDAGLVQAEVSPDVRALVQSEQQRMGRERRSRLNPLAFRIGLFDPSPWLDRFGWLQRLLAHPATMAVWWTIVLSALAAAVLQAPALQAYAGVHFLSPSFLAMAWAAYPLMKALHELAHALMLRRHGCEVPEVGISLLLLVPLPYVDARDAHRLTSRRARVQVSAAGIAVELAVAALAFGLWCVVEDGWLRELAFVLATLGSVSTVLFNANPLMKFDGYHVMCDALELPNLGPRSQAATNQRCRHWLYRRLGIVPDEQDRAVAGEDALERIALRLYAPAAWAYRCLIAVLLSAWLARISPWLGVAAALWGVWSQLAMPVTAWWRELGRAPSFETHRLRVAAAGAVAAAGLVAALALVPVSSHVVAEAVVWIPEHAQVRAEVMGEVSAVHARDGDWVEVGQPLVSLTNPTLLAKRAVLVAQIESLNVERHDSPATQPLRARNAMAALQRDEAALARIDEELAALSIQARTSGRLVLPRALEMMGRQVSRGERLGYVLRQGPTQVRAAVPERAIDALRARAATVSVMLDALPGTVIPARLLGGTPAALSALPDAAMADRNGGRVPTVSPAGPGPTEDAPALQPAEPMFALDIEADQPLQLTGGLARVRFDLAPQPLLTTWAQSARQLLLKHLSGEAQ